MIRTAVNTAVIFMLLTQQAVGACVEYAPATVSVSGTLERRTFPGRPNFENVDEGDEPETGFYLALSEPICTSGDLHSGVAYPQQGVSSIQLILDQPGYVALRPLLGQTIAISGMLVAAHTGHHHAPLLIDHVSLASDNGH